MHFRRRKNTRRQRSSSGFTLLEVMIALAILTVSLLILVSAQSNAARMSAQADKILIGSMLARHKLTEVVLLMEKDGFSEQDVLEEDGDFEDVFPDLYPEFHWHTLVKKVEAEDISRVLDAAGSTGLGGDAGNPSGEDMPDGPDTSMLGGVMEQISETLAARVREVHVQVEWVDGSERDEVTLIDYVTR